MDSAARSLLLRALSDKESPLFMTKSTEAVMEYMKRYGYKLKRPLVKSILQSRKSSMIGITNASERKISEVSKPFDIKQAFWVCMHGDVIVLSRQKRYGTNYRLVLILVEQISNYVYLEALYSTKFESVKKAFDSIFDRCASLPDKCETLIFDNGVEVSSNRFKNWFSKLGIRINYVFKRHVRLSRGSPLAEISIRRFRKHLESYRLEFGMSTDFKSVLSDIEHTMNNEPLHVLGGISSLQALSHDPKYMSQLKFSNRIKRRKFLKQEINIERNLKKFDIVRIKKFRKKDKFGKESHGIMSSNYYVILDVKVDDFVSRYQLGSVFSLKPVFEGRYTYHELVVVNISIAFARYHECVNFSGPSKIVDGHKIFTPNYSPHEYIMSVPK